MNRDISKLRKDYVAGALSEQQVDPNPIEQFREWFKEALESEVREPNAMVLSTAINHQPSSRVVLLKGFDNDGFVFFTNYDSRKGHELHANPLASLLFFWDALERQVRIEGSIEKLDETLSDQYFDSRPYGSRIGAIASPQSHKIAGREVLEAKVKALEQQYPEGAAIQRPTNWGGYVLKPKAMEFWQGRASRLHDRIVYELEAGDWMIYRVAP